MTQDEIQELREKLSNAFDDMWDDIDRLFAHVSSLREALASARATLANIDEPAATGYDTYGACERIDKALPRETPQ